MSTGIAEKVIKLRGQRSRSWPDKLTYNGAGIQFDDVASKVICSFSFLYGK